LEIFIFGFQTLVKEGIPFSHSKFIHYPNINRMAHAILISFEK